MPFIKGHQWFLYVYPITKVYLKPAELRIAHFKKERKRIFIISLSENEKCKIPLDVLSRVCGLWLLIHVRKFRPVLEAKSSDNEMTEWVSSFILVTTNIGMGTEKSPVGSVVHGKRPYLQLFHKHLEDFTGGCAQGPRSPSVKSNECPDTRNISLASDIGDTLLGDFLITSKTITYS